MRWTKVEDGLPEAFRFVRAKTADGKIFERAYHTFGVNWSESRLGRMDRTHTNIIEWQPITPPKGDV